MSKTVQKTDVRKMFDSIAHKYDFLNHFLSFGVDIYWRKKLVNFLNPKPNQKILDVAAGTGDVGFAILKKQPKAQVIGIDFSEKMLEIGRKKIEDRIRNSKFRISNTESRIQFQFGDAQNLEFEDETFNGVTIAFGIRNVKNREKAISEFYRVLKPGGKLVILEFGKPRFLLTRLAYLLYSKVVIPIVGKVFSKHIRAYSYLPQTISEFPSREKFSKLILSAGFEKTGFQTLTNGVVTLFWGLK